MTNGVGALTEGPYTYDAYGKPNLTTGTPFRYTGRKYDAETGLYYYRARYYSPTLGRFLQTDPVGYDDDLNLYTYVANDPLNGADPLGLYESSAALRAVVPGQVYFDQAVTAFEGGDRWRAGPISRPQRWSKFFSSHLSVNPSWAPAALEGSPIRLQSPFRSTRKSKQDISQARRNI